MATTTASSQTPAAIFHRPVRRVATKRRGAMRKVAITRRESQLLPVWLVLPLIVGYVSLAFGEEPPPQSPDLKKRAIALGRAGSLVGFDVPRDGEDRPDLDGWGILGRVDLHPGERGWGVQLGYALKDGGTGSGGEISLAQTGLHAYYAWEGEVEDGLRLRFYPKIGLSRADFEETVPLTGTFSDSAIGPSLGLGVEWGGRSWGVLFDVGWTFVDIELIPGQKESLNVSAGFIGLAYCF
jgi:hypothetical protein